MWNLKKKKRSWKNSKAETEIYTDNKQVVDRRKGFEGRNR